MHVQRSFQIFLFLVVLAAAVGNAVSLPADEALIAAIDRLVEKQGFTDEGPGVAILVIQPGKLHFHKGYGLADIDAAAPITPRTLFELASVSKTFTATAVLMLYERGKLTLDDDVRTYLPELPQYAGGPIHIRDLLHHVSGLPDYMEFENVSARHGDYWTNDDYVGEFARQRKEHPLDFPTGARYEYNNTNFMLAATIVERVSQQPFGMFLHDEIFEPAGMKHSFVYASPTAVPQRHLAAYNRAIGYEKGTKKPWRAAWGSPPARHEKLLTVGDGGVWTNLEDMAAWDAALRSGSLLKRPTMQQALKPSHTRDGKRNDYGLGWELYPDGKTGLVGYGHDGSWGGFRTHYYRYLTADRTTVILSNRGNFDPDAFWYKLEAVIEKHPAD